MSERGRERERERGREREREGRVSKAEKSKSESGRATYCHHDVDVVLRVEEMVHFPLGAVVDVDPKGPWKSVLLHLPLPVLDHREGAHDQCQVLGAGACRRGPSLLFLPNGHQRENALGRMRGWGGRVSKAEKSKSKSERETYQSFSQSHVIRENASPDVQGSDWSGGTRDFIVEHLPSLLLDLLPKWRQLSIIGIRLPGVHPRHRSLLMVQ